MSVGNENLDKITLEMTRLLKIIAEDQEIIFKKDQTIEELNSNIDDKDELLKKEKEINISTIEGYSKEKLEMEDKIRKMNNENTSKIYILNAEIDNITKITDENQIQEMKVSLEKQEDIFNTYDSLKAKIKQSMWIIEQKSNEIEQIQKAAGTHTNFDSRITELKGENLELKDIICKSKSDIKTLEKNAEEKNRTIDGNIAQFD